MRVPTSNGFAGPLTFPIDSFRYSASDRIDDWTDQWEKYAECVYALGGDREDIYEPTHPEPIACRRAAVAGENASNVAEDLYGYKDQDGNEWLDGEEDAMRHCLWNAFMAQDTSVAPARARRISALHEELNPNELDSASMDKHNNEFGVRLYETGKADDATEAVQSSQNAVEQGDLIILNSNPR